MTENTIVESSQVETEAATPAKKATVNMASKKATPAKKATVKKATKSEPDVEKTPDDSGDYTRKRITAPARLATLKEQWQSGKLPKGIAVRNSGGKFTAYEVK